MKRTTFILISVITSFIILGSFFFEDVVMIQMFNSNYNSTPTLGPRPTFTCPDCPACPTLSPSLSDISSPTCPPVSCPTSSPSNPPSNTPSPASIIPSPPNITFKSYPYSVVPRQAPTKPLKILFWSTNAFYNSIMDRWWFHHLLSVQEMHEYYETVLWGPEFDEYDNSKSMAENILKKYGRKDYFDVVYPLWNTIGDAGHMDEYSLNVFYEHESYDNRNKGYYENDKVRVMMYAYQQSLQEYFPTQKDTLIVHLPHSVRLQVMDDVQCDGYKRDLGLAGASYKLRNFYGDWIGNNKFTGLKAEPFRHPGYTEQTTMAQVKQSGLNVNITEERLRAFLNFMCESKICMTSTIFPDRLYSLRKYVEFASVGCVVVADLPWDRQEEWRMWISEIDPYHITLQTEQLRLNYLLAHPEVMQKKRDYARALIESRYQIAHTFDIAYDMFRMREKHGWTGLIYPFGCDTLFTAEEAFIKMNDSVVYFPCHQERDEANPTVRCPDPMERTSSGCVCGEKCKSMCNACGTQSEHQCGEILHCTFTGRRTCLNSCKATPFEAAQLHFRSDQPSVEDIITCVAEITSIDKKYINSTNPYNGAESDAVEIFFAPEALTKERTSMEYLLDDFIGAVNKNHKMCKFSPHVWARTITKISIP